MTQDDFNYASYNEGVFNLDIEMAGLYEKDSENEDGDENSADEGSLGKRDDKKEDKKEHKLKLFNDEQKSAFIKAQIIDPF